MSVARHSCMEADLVCMALRKWMQVTNITLRVKHSQSNEDNAFCTHKQRAENAYDLAATQSC